MPDDNRERVSIVAEIGQTIQIRRNVGSTLANIYINDFYVGTMNENIILSISIPPAKRFPRGTGAH